MKLINCLFGLAIVAHAAMATERITMTCRFDALADGYSSFTVQQKMLLTKRDSYGEFKNKDGSYSDYWWAGGQYVNTNRDFDGIEYIHGTTSSSKVLFYDGKNWHDIYFSSTSDDNIHYTLNTEDNWVINSGNVSCSWAPGW